MKLRYIGESFGVDSLTNGKIYEAGSSVKEINDKKIRITLSDGKYDIKILND